MKILTADGVLGAVKIGTLGASRAAAALIRQSQQHPAPRHSVTHS